MIQIVLAALITGTAHAAGIEGDAPATEPAANLLAFAPSGLPAGAGFELDRLFDASRGRNLSADSAPQILSHPRPEPAPTTFSQEYRRTFRILVSRRDRIDRFDPLIVRYAEKYRLNPRLLKAIIAAESEFRTFARSPSGALGLMQLMPVTAECMGVPRGHLFDPEANIRAGAAYMAYLFRTAYRLYGLEGSFAQAPQWLARQVIAAYNGGMKMLRRGARLCRETRGYVAKVFLYKSSAVTRIELFPRRAP